MTRSCSHLVRSKNSLRNLTARHPRTRTTHSTIGSSGGWKQTGGKYDGKPCAKQPGQTTKPYCRDADARASMSKDERDKRAAKKRKEDPNPDRKGKAKMVTQEGKTYGDFVEEKDACYHKVKASAKVCLLPTPQVAWSSAARRVQELR